MKKLLMFLLMALHCGYGACARDGYFAYLKELGAPLGNYREGEIELITDPAEIEKIEKMQEGRLLKKGIPPERATAWSRVGVVNEDQYWVWLRDAVYFPKGVPGTYNRLLWKGALKGKAPGVAVLPVLPSGKIVLNVNFRHATRSWELELPRGNVEPQETVEAAAQREVKEETGLAASSLTFLGEVAPDTGALGSVIPVYMGKISLQGESHPEESEAIAGTLTLTVDELKEGLKQGSLEVTLHGKKRRLPIRDGFLTFALVQAELRHLL